MSGPVFKMQVNEDGSITPLYEGTNPNAGDSPGVTFKYPNFTWFFPQFPGEQPAPAPAPKRKKRAPLPPTDKLTVTVQEAADMLGMSRAKLYPMVRRGEIASIKVGGQRLIPLAALEQFIKEQLGDGETSEINRHRRVPAKRRTLPGTPAAG